MHSSRSHGHVDALVIDGVFCRVNGWAIDPAGEPLQLSHIHFGSHVVTDFVVQRYDRPDVTKAYPHARADAGFELRFLLLGLPGEALACDALTLRGRAQEQADGEETLALSAMWPALRAREAVAGALAIGDEPWLPEVTAHRLRELLRTAKCYVEYGSGGTTVMATSMGVPEVVTTESDSNWLAALRHKLRLLGSTTHAELIHVDIGPTGDLGYPTSETHWKEYFNYPVAAWKYCSSRNLNPDVVLIDGRFRVACFLVSLVRATPGTRILFDDYFDRPHYHVVERFARPVGRHDRAAEFRIAGAPAAQDICLELLSVMSDPR